MKFEIILSDHAKNDIEKLEKSGDKTALKKLYFLLEELETHPTLGTGKPELLKHYEIPTWSRRISHQHPLVYRIKEEIVTVLILSARGHYDDK